MKATTIEDRCRRVADACDGGDNLASVVDAPGVTTATRRYIGILLCR